ncbi:hypothetical protein BOS5A_10090 [Bosea sp. EC-HK365B]|nr:hypothetical protein BOSE21B_10983 [Bosea sp. 21B]VVT43546.1 hypothetical protein BOS5A_10090 [Bosea sp. EC-HK365B]VXC32704.1 hypothetical protein BOSE127_180157 [Bosea sp. 127]
MAMPTDRAQPSLRRVSSCVPARSSEGPTGIEEVGHEQRRRISAFCNLAGAGAGLAEPAPEQWRADAYGHTEATGSGRRVAHQRDGRAPGMPLAQRGRGAARRGWQSVFMAQARRLTKSLSPQVRPPPFRRGPLWRSQRTARPGAARSPP